MIVRIENKFINTDYIITGETSKDKKGEEHLSLFMTEGEIKFSGTSADYFRTILDALHFTEVKGLSDKLPKPEAKDEEY